MSKVVLGLIFLLAISHTAHASAYDFYVDKNSQQATENGTATYPFRTINAALAHIRTHGLKEKSIFVKKGIYNESLELTSGADLFGEDRHETVVDAEGLKYAMHFLATSSRVHNLTVQNAEVNLKIDKKSKAFLSGCSIKDARSDGIEVDRSTYSAKRRFVMTDSSVKNSGKRGMYIFRRKIELRNNEIEDNDEEGIDLHSKLRGKISGNTIKNNAESGVELILSGTKLNVKGNTLSGNKAQGLSIQVYNPEKGKIKVSRNTILDNSGYGIRYARYDHGKLQVKFRDFIRQCVRLSGNTISGNGSGDYGYQ